MVTSLSRRRFIGISAAAAGLAVLPLRHQARAEAELVTWRGLALGAVATMQIHHTDRSIAERLIQRSIAELRRLERVFSLYRSDSTLVELNRRGVLEDPPPELVDLLLKSRNYSELTGGAFDPTVQPLWKLHLDHFSTPGADPGGPPAEALRTVLERVGYRHLAIGPDRIAMRRGMALTLNGIAQGYITDRVVDLLRVAGLESSLVDLGEARALGAGPAGRAWNVAIADPAAPDRPLATLPIIDRAVATSGAYGFQFDPSGRFNHIFHPATGRSAGLHRSVTVVMPTATAADALSTAFSLMPIDGIERTLSRIGEGEAYVLTTGGMRIISARS